jgi:formate hydrogenlyase subunit 4
VIRSMPSSLASLLLVLAVAPLLPGVVRRTTSLLTGRRGAPTWQLYADLWKLSRRGVVYSTTTTWLFRLAPVVALATALVAALLVPFDGRNALVRFTGDAVAFAYALALGRFLLVLGAFDTGSSFEGMGASREVTFGALVEFGLLLTFAAMSVATGELSLSGVLGGSLAGHWVANAPALGLLAAGLFGLTLAECARVPVDDPATHLELTMIHEVMVLDHGGPDLALILAGGAVKLALFGALIVGLVVPRATWPPWAAALGLVGGLVAFAVAIGLVEAGTARLRLPKVPLFLAGSATLGALGLLLLLG